MDWQNLRYGGALCYGQLKILKHSSHAGKIKRKQKHRKSTAAAAMMSAMVDPQDKMRSRDMNKVARGEQAPKPTHEFRTVSPPPQNYKPKSSSPSSPPFNKEINDNNMRVEDLETKPQTRHCYASYVEYHKCVKEKGNNALECEKFAKHYKSLCPNEWIDRWNRARELGTFPAL